jgi:hypothetical protein
VEAGDRAIRGAGSPLAQARHPAFTIRTSEEGRVGIRLRCRSCPADRFRSGSNDSRHCRRDDLKYTPDGATIGVSGSSARRSAPAPPDRVVQPPGRREDRPADCAIGLRGVLSDHRAKLLQVNRALSRNIDMAPIHRDGHSRHLCFAW